MSWHRYRWGCPGGRACRCDGGLTGVFKSWEALLAPRRPEAKWLLTASPYPWPMWWQPRPPRYQPETYAQAQKREARAIRTMKPAGYTWPMWHTRRAA